MPQVQLAIAVASTILALVGFLLRNAIAGFNKRLDRLEDRLGDFVTHVAAQSVDVKTAKDEINNLRDSVDVLEKDINILKAVQDRCRACNNR